LAFWIDFGPAAARSNKQLGVLLLIVRSIVDPGLVARLLHPCSSRPGCAGVSFDQGWGLACLGHGAGAAVAGLVCSRAPPAITCGIGQPDPLVRLSGPLEARLSCGIGGCRDQRRWVWLCCPGGGEARFGCEMGGPRAPSHCHLDRKPAGPPCRCHEALQARGPGSGRSGLSGPGVARQANLQARCGGIGGRGWVGSPHWPSWAERELATHPSQWRGFPVAAVRARSKAKPLRLLRPPAPSATPMCDQPALLLFSAPLLVWAAPVIKLGGWRGPILYPSAASGFLGTALHGDQNCRHDDLRMREVGPSRLVAAQRSAHHKRCGSWGLADATRLDETAPTSQRVAGGALSLSGRRAGAPGTGGGNLERRHPPFTAAVHWALPGLSGWLQVNMPYTSSVERLRLELSYDLFYLRKQQHLADLLILFKNNQGS